MNSIPESVDEKKSEVDSIFLRTVLRKDVYERLKALAQEYSTGQGHWDFGVAIQMLLDNYDNSRMASQSEKLDLIINMLTLPTREKPEEEEVIELLGGTKISKK